MAASPWGLAALGVGWSLPATTPGIRARWRQLSMAARRR